MRAHFCDHYHLVRQQCCCAELVCGCRGVGGVREGGFSTRPVRGCFVRNWTRAHGQIVFWACPVTSSARNTGASSAKFLWGTVCQCALYCKKRSECVERVFCSWATSLQVMTVTQMQEREETKEYISHCSVTLHCRVLESPSSRCLLTPTSTVSPSQPLQVWFVTALQQTRTLAIDAHLGCCVICSPDPACRVL